MPDIRLAAEGPELSAADVASGLLLLDGSWRVYRHDQLIATAPATSSKQLRAIKGRQHLGPGRPSQAANTGGSSATTTEGRVHRVHKALRSS